MTSAIDEFIAEYPDIEFGSLESRLKRCMAFWQTIPADCRVSTIINILERYRKLRQVGGNTVATTSNTAATQPKDSFALSELTTAAYHLASSKEGNTLKMRPNEAQSLEILCTAFHTCG